MNKQITVGIILEQKFSYIEFEHNLIHNVLNSCHSTAQCLQTVTEDNKEAVQICSLPESTSILEEALLSPGDSMQHALLQVHTAGMLGSSI